MGISRDEADGEEVIWMAEARKERKSEEGASLYDRQNAREDRTCRI